MEEKESSGKYFQPIPLEYNHIEELANETHKRLAAIDKAIAAVPKDKGPAYELKPTWADELPKLTREQIVAGLTNQKKNIEKDLNYKVDEALVDAKPETAKSIKNSVSYMIDTENDFKGKTAEELQGAKDQAKSLDESQNISLVQLYNEQLGLTQNDVKNLQSGKDKQPGDSADSKELLLSEFYANKYDFEIFDISPGVDIESISPDFDKD